MMRTIKFNYLILILLFAGITLFGLYQVKTYTSNSGKSKLEERFTLSVYRVEGGWGYDILENNKIIIHQDIIPAISNKQPFQTATDARKTGQMVLKKIRGNQLPIITIEELIELNISN